MALLFSRLSAWWRRFDARSRNAHALGAIDDHLLADIGVTRRDFRRL